MDPNQQIDTDAQEYRAFLVKLAADNLCRGIIEEPRAYYDRLTFDPTISNAPTFGASNTFLNGERHPVRLTHMTAAVAYVDEAGNTAQDERLIQRMRLRMRHHDYFYMRNQFVPLPLWNNTHTAAADVVSFGTSAWFFERPLVLSARDALEVSVQLEDNPPDEDGNVPVSVSFTGVGLYSRRPYFLFGDVTIADDTIVNIAMDNYRNDGAEPILITDMTTNVGNQLGLDDPTGDIRRARVRVWQNGNGTNADWFQGPTGTALPIEMIPASLLGVRSGRAVTHRFPGDGLIWEPGEGIQIAVNHSGITQGVFPDVQLDIALLGYIAVQ